MDADNICKGEDHILVMEKSLAIHNHVKTQYGVGDMWVGISERDADGVFSRYCKTKK